MNESGVDMIRRIEQHPPQSVAVVTENGGAYTFGTLLKGVHILDALQELRSVVFCLCRNTIGCLMGYLSCLSSGAAPLLLEAGMDRDMLAALIQLYKPRRLWAPADMAAGFGGCTLVTEMEDYVLLDTGAAAYPVHDDLALLLTTSGSTGSPKLVRQSMKNIVSNAAAIAEYLELGPGDRAITTLPMHYTYGLSVIHSHLLVGGRLLLTGRSVLEPEFWDFFDSHGATSLAGVPATYGILERIGFFQRELPSLRYFTQAGGKLPVAMHEKCARFAKERGLRFYVMYGQTEATARMSYLPWDRSLEKCGSIGIAIPGGAFSLVDAAGGEIKEPDKIGELVYRGENVTLGYAEGSQDLAMGDQRRGVLYTGDLGYRDTEGFYYITGRMGRFLKMAGRRVNLDECQQLLKALFPDADCACCGRDDRLSIFMTLPAEEIDDARRQLARRLALPLSSVAAQAVATIPRSSAGKILYPKLEELGGAERT
jgi:acyl-CoA synthetase (AMP-forming)/AMP-acid ligase II